MCIKNSGKGAGKAVGTPSLYKSLLRAVGAGTYYAFGEKNDNDQDCAIDSVGRFYPPGSGGSGN
ncbi:MAG: hypothetical protein ACI4V3_08940, partial [Faecousia sp.]